MTQPPIKADGIKLPSISRLMDFNGDPLGVLTTPELIAALESVMPDLPRSDPAEPDRLWLDNGFLRFTGTAWLVGDSSLVGSSFVS